MKNVENVKNKEKILINKIRQRITASQRFQRHKIYSMDLIQLQSLVADVFSINGARTIYARKKAVPAQSQNVASMSPVDLETYRAQCPPNRTSKIPA